jgi:hypothetical protein
MLPILEVSRCDGVACISQLANGSVVGVGRENKVADTLC